MQPSSISVIMTWSVKTLHHRNDEMRNCESALWISAWSPPVVTSSKSCREEIEETSSISDFGTWRVEMTLHRIPETQNAEMRKTPFGVGFRYRELECRNTSPQGMPKCGNAEMRKHLFV
jgi:hypothetical protein